MVLKNRVLLDAHNANNAYKYARLSPLPRYRPTVRSIICPIVAPPPKTKRFNFRRRMGESPVMQDSKPKVVLFYKNGDRNFRGYHVTVTKRRFQNIDNLLGELTRVTNLAQGARFIFTPNTGQRIERLEQLSDGKSYVCGSFPKLKKIKYGCRPDGSDRADKKQPNNKGFIPAPAKQKMQLENNNNRVHHSLNIKPRIITIIRRSINRPRRSIKILLNKRTAQTYDQVLNDVASSVGVDGGSGVRKLFTLDGKLILGLSELFGQDNIFIAVGNEKFRPSDLSNILDDFQLNKCGTNSKSTSRSTNISSAIPPIKTPKQNYKKPIQKDVKTNEIQTLKKLPEIKRSSIPKIPKEERIKSPSYITDDENDMASAKGNNDTEIDDHIVFNEVDMQDINSNVQEEEKSISRSSRHDGTPVYDKEKSATNTSNSSIKSSKSSKPSRSSKSSGMEDLQSNHTDEILSEKESNSVDTQSMSNKSNTSRKSGKSVLKSDKSSDISTIGNKLGKQAITSNHSKEEILNEHENVEDVEIHVEMENVPPKSDSESEPVPRGKSDSTIKSEKSDSTVKSEKSDSIIKSKKSDSIITSEKSLNDGDDSVQLEQKQEATKPRKIVNESIASRNEIEEIYSLSKKLGDGNFAIVKEGLHKTTKIKYAIKIIDGKKVRGKEEMLENEIAIQRECAHPNIVQLFHDYHSPVEIFLVMELVTGGDFFDLVAQNVKFEEEEATLYVRDLCSGLDYLHHREIVHRDIKPENLMVCETPTGELMIKIADFGLAMKVTQPIFTICGTPTYVAPEILMEKGYGLKVDVWAAGVIIYIMLCGFPPFRSPNRKQTELFDLIEAGEFEFLEPYWDDVSDLAKELISDILEIDKKKRLTAKQVLSHPWLQTYGRTRNDTMDSDSEKISACSRFKATVRGIQSIQRMKNLLDLKIQRGEDFITHLPPHNHDFDKDVHGNHDFDKDVS